MWAFVVQRLKSHNIVYGESIQQPPGHEKWPAPIHLRTTVKLMPETYVKCNWDDSPVSKRRREFCNKFEGYNHVCRCKCFRTFVEYDEDFLKFQVEVQLQVTLKIRSSGACVSGKVWKGQHPSFIALVCGDLRRTFLIWGALKSSVSFERPKSAS